MDAGRPVATTNCTNTRSTGLEQYYIVQGHILYVLRAGRASYVVYVPSDMGCS